MQPYFIKSFKSVSRENLEFSVIDHKKYQSNVNESIMFFYDFMCNPDYKISRVLRCERANPNNGAFNLPFGTVFAIADILSDSQTNMERKKIITGFKSIDGVMRIQCRSVATGREINDVDLSTAIQYVAPVVREAVRETTPTQTSTSLLGLQAQILAANPRAIKLANDTTLQHPSILRTRRESIPEFLVKFFTNWNVKRATLFTDNNEEQTSVNRRRSLGDIFMICRYYYPTCTLKEVAKALYVTLPTMINSGFRTSICSTIHKRVWYYSYGNANNITNQNSNDEYSKTYDWWISNLNA